VKPMAQQVMQPIAENIWWVLPGKLAGVRKPTAEELPKLQASGISAIVSVFHEADNLALYQQVGLPALWLPIAIDAVPNQAQRQEFQQFVASQNQLGHAVAVHCSTGKHRTGTMLAVYLMSAGATYESAMQTLLAANPQLELPATQIQFLKALANVMTVEQPITDNLWWVIPGKLAGVRKPTAEELSALQKSGVGAIVSVQDDPSNLDVYEQVGIPYLWLPTTGGTAPSQEQIQDVQTFIDQQNHRGNGVAIHCTNGRRRTGTMLAAYLIQSGASYGDAMQTLSLANPDLELREAQTTFLQTLARE
jgi:protein-tyrosine phosphatase